MTKTFKTILGLILAWALVAQAGIVIAQSPNITSMHTAATTTANGTALVVNGPAGNPANTIGAAGVQVANSAGTFTITFETLTSGSTWTAVMATNMTDDTRATTATAAGQYTILLGGAVQLRARISACSSCSVTVVGRLVPGLVARVASGGGGGGSGDFVGPASSTDNAIVRFDGTTGKLGQNSVVLVGDTGNVTGLGTLNTHTLPGGTDTLVGKATTDTFTNKTYDTAGTGNSFSINGVAVTANTGTGAVARATSPTFVTPTLGAATGTSFNGNTFTTGTYTLTGAAGKTLTFSNTLTLAGTDATTMTFPTTTATIARTDAGQTFTGTQAFGAITASGTVVQTSASATAFESGPNGGTNPVLRVVNSTASQADGVSITGLAAGSGVTFTALSSGSNALINFVPKGTGRTTFTGTNSNTVVD